MKKQLDRLNELKELFNMDGYIFIHYPKKSTKNRFKIHSTKCKNLKTRYEEMHGVSDKKLGVTNGQEYFYYDSFAEVMKDHPKSLQCKICNPK